MRNRCRYGAELPTNSRGEYTASVKVAEGEELGSNLLRVAQRIPANSGGLAGRVSGKGGQNPPLGAEHWQGACLHDRF
jgi:hypothetical protein